jgi:L-2,4-diaminobutyrate decarboxylase
MKTRDEEAFFSGAGESEIEGDLRVLVDFEEKGIPLGELSRLIDKALVPHLMRYDSPGFQAFFNARPERGAEWGARLALAYNQGVTNWQVSPGGAMLEALCCRALCRLFRFPDGSDATFMYCGTYANQQALYMALHRHAERRGFDLAKKGLVAFADFARPVVAASAQTHFSLRHAVRTLGLGEENLISLPVDQSYRLDIERLKEILAAVKRDGRKEVFCLVATAGTTSTGSIDPILPALEECQRSDIWLHVDGAYGLAYGLVPEYSYLFNGYEQADSVSWDPHKQLGIPIPSSLLFARRGRDFERLAIYGEYFNRRDDPRPNPGLKSPPSTRPFSALPLVASLRHQGMAGVIKRLRAPLLAIKKTAEKLRREPGIELVNEPETGVLCLRVVPPGVPEMELDALQRGIYEKVKSDRRRSISITDINGKSVLRLVAVSPRVTGKALLETVSVLRGWGQVLKGQGKPLEI